MTTREARKIATLRAAVTLKQDDTLPQNEALALSDADKIKGQQNEIADALASRYGLSVGEIPSTTSKIVDGVLDGSL